MSTLLNDPVCGMQLKSQRYATEYQHTNYAFCSPQCRDRFIANPHLYVGYSGQRSPKQEGLQVIKKRCLRLTKSLTNSQAHSLSETLQEMMGIVFVDVEGSKVDIAYDLMQVTAEQIETKISEIGFQLGDEWVEQVRRAFVHFNEEFEVANLEVYKRRRFHRY